MMQRRVRFGASFNGILRLVDRFDETEGGVDPVLQRGLVIEENSARDRYRLTPGEADRPGRISIISPILI